MPRRTAWVDNEIHPIAYLSRSVTAVEAKYHDLCMGTAGGSETRQLELLGVVWALDALQNILTGCPRVVLSTDHRNIRHMLVEAQKLHTGVQNDRLLRWALKLSSYPNVDIQYRPGIRNEVADCLSRLQDNPSLVDQLKKGGGAAQDLQDDPRKPRSEVTKNGYFLGDHDLLYRQAGTYKREGLPPEAVSYTHLTLPTILRV